MQSMVTEQSLPAGLEAETAETPVNETGVSEFVLGPRQAGSLLFVAIVILAAFSAGSYLAGKASSPRAIAPAPPPAIEATITQAPPPVEAPPKAAPAPEPPIFAEPTKGSIYLQIGAVEKGIAVILTEGLRKHGFEAFVAPGPNEKVFRVLIGPLADPEEFAHAKSEVDQIGLSNFTRKYQQ
jgi:cell division septation protein DedD